MLTQKDWTSRILYLAKLFFNGEINLFPNEENSKRIYCYEICHTRHTEGKVSGLNEKTLDSNKNLHTKKITDKVNTYVNIKGIVSVFLIITFLP